jgi:hypothetical protein
MGRRCDECAASGRCGEELCQPACVVDEAAPGLGMGQGDLRISPTRIDPGQQVWVHVMGMPLYVGALWYGVRVGSTSEHSLQGVMSSGLCDQAFETDSLAQGVYPVWVSQYGGGDPWVLAGFLGASSDPLSCTQPGYSCSAAAECCEDPGAPVDCVGGRCTFAGG